MPKTKSNANGQLVGDMKEVKDYVKKNSHLLFKHAESNSQIALFDNKGFFFSPKAQLAYDKIKSQPHLYVAWTNSTKGYYYIGESLQPNGRWRRSHAYHLGTLAYHLLDELKRDQNHAHWIESWMNMDGMVKLENNSWSIELKGEVFISFIPFEIYDNKEHQSLNNDEIKKLKLNKKYQDILIESYLKEGVILLNVQVNNALKSKKISDA